MMTRMTHVFMVFVAMSVLAGCARPGNIQGRTVPQGTPQVSAAHRVETLQVATLVGLGRATGFRLQTDTARSAAPTSAFRSGGPPPDGIPALDPGQVKFMSPADAS
ncbi:MAG: hypothetical protein HY335_05395, partial [Deinococcus sp.]|nr:hypothetical protein [Deinococcus sp.]